MDVTILGSGTAFPAPGHSPAGIVVQQAGITLLLDIGPGTISRLHLANLSPDRLDTLLLTHLHPDHTIDFASLLQIFDSSPNAKRISPFQVYGCPGTKVFFKRLLSLYPAITPHSYPVLIKEVFHSIFNIGGITIKSAPSGHTNESIAYRLEAGGVSLVYSGDANEQGELAALSMGCDVLICECSFPSGWKTEDHLNADSVGRLAEKAGVKELVLTHRYPPALSVDLRKQIRQSFRSKLILANDGLHFTV